MRSRLVGVHLWFEILKYLGDMHYFECMMHWCRAELIDKQIYRNEYACRIWKFFRSSASCYEYRKGGLH